MTEICNRGNGQKTKGKNYDFKQVRFIYVCRLYAVRLGLRWLVGLDAMAHNHPLMGGEGPGGPAPRWWGF